jgi:hypothetical protein
MKKLIEKEYPFFFSDVSKKVSYGESFNKKIHQYINLIKKGKNTFGFFTDQYYSSQQKFIWALSIFLANKTNKPVLILSPNGKEGFFWEETRRMTKNFYIKGKGNASEVSPGVYFIDCIHKDSENIPREVLDIDFIELWDLPACEEIQKCENITAEMLNGFDHISIVSNKDVGKDKTIQSLKKYFAGNNIKINFDEITNEKSMRTKGIFRQIFDRMIS